ncbi:MAG: phosphotransferase family protein [Rhodovibrionaceae bacterium]
MLEARRQAVAAWLAKQSGAARAEVREMKPLSGGAIQENWALDVTFEGGDLAGERALVLRTDAPSGVAVSLSRAEEFALLRAAEAAGVTVPKPHFLCRDAAVLGKDFVVMDRLEGVALGPKVVKDAALGGDRAALVERLGRELARIHSILPPRGDLEFLDLPKDPAQAAVAGLRGHLDALGEPHPALEWGLAWCAAHPPAGREITLVHQDFRTGNLMLDEKGLTGVLDWEFAAWGDPMADLGWFCARCWRFGRPDLEAGGLGAREDFYRGYERECGGKVDPEAVAYWEVMAHIRWAVIALQQGARHYSGEQVSLELALTGRIAPELELELLRMTPPHRWSAT